jgi:hypothetical protein
MSRRKFWTRTACALFALSMTGVPPKLEANTVQNMPPSALDTSFLREEPLRKQKLAVDLSAITQAEHMQTVREAINPIVQFISRLSALPPRAANPPSAFTDGAVFRLRLPPKIKTPGHEMRLSHIRKYDWVVSGNSTISFTVDFGLIRAKPEYTDRFVFVRENGAWKFDRHEWDQPKFWPKK